MIVTAPMRPTGLQDHPEENAAAVWWFPTNPRGCPLGLQGGLSLGLDDFPCDKTSARRLLENFVGRPTREQVLNLQRVLKDLKHHLELVDRPSVTDSLAGPLLCALTFGASKGRKARAIKLKKRRYEQLVKHFSEETEPFGFVGSISWQFAHYDVDNDDEDDIYGYDGASWKSPCIIFRPVKQQQQERKRQPQLLRLDSTDRSNSSSNYDPVNNTNRAWEFVEMVLLLQNRLHKRNSNVYTQVRVIAADDLFFFAKRFLDQQTLYQTDKSASYSVDIGYHYVRASLVMASILAIFLVICRLTPLSIPNSDISQTKEENLKKIKTGGLLTKADRDANEIEASANGSAYGDGEFSKKQKDGFALTL